MIERSATCYVLGEPKVQITPGLQETEHRFWKKNVSPNRLQRRKIVLLEGCECTRYLQHHALIYDLS